MTTIKILKSILFLIDVLPYSQTAKSDIIETICNWIEQEEEIQSILK